MEYNDNRVLSLAEYEEMAKAYSSELKKKGFIFVKMEEEDYVPLAKEVFSLLTKLKSSLYFLGGFLGTGKLYTVNEKHIGSLQLLFNINDQPMPQKVVKDKTKCFLSMLAQESTLLLKLFELAQNCPFSNQIFNIMKERLETLSHVFNLNPIAARL